MGASFHTSVKLDQMASTGKIVPFMEKISARLLRAVHTVTKYGYKVIRQMAMIGVMTAVTCIAAPFSIPIPVSPVPLSLTTFILYLSVYILGTRNAFSTETMYRLAQKRRIRKPITDTAAACPCLPL